MEAERNQPCGFYSSEGGPALSAGQRRPRHAHKRRQRGRGFKTGTLWRAPLPIHGKFRLGFTALVQNIAHRLASVMWGRTKRRSCCQPRTVLEISSLQLSLTSGRREPGGRYRSEQGTQHQPQGTPAPSHRSASQGMGAPATALRGGHEVDGST
jgi:hypothetical protein